ncbi:MAG: MucB/RseB C-terminal domain-containing protein [Burkholderiales bacterium]
MKFAVAALVASFGCAGGVSANAMADDAQFADAAVWLGRMSGAANQLCYMGTFVRESGGQMESLRIAHYADGKDELEKVEFLDGPAREVVRNNDNVAVYFPASKTIKLVHRKAKKFFPALLNSAPNTYSENYRVTLANAERVAGHECQGVLFEPKDNLRFPRWFCAEKTTGLIIKTNLKDERGALLEQMAFTQLTLGKSQVKRDHTKTSYPDAKQAWRTDASALEDLKPSESGWVVSNPPTGFRRIMEVQRNMPNKDKPIYHQVLSDGLATVSIFIEPYSAQSKPRVGANHQGAVNTYISSVADHLVTVIGEVPLATVQQIAQSLKPPAK